MPTSLARPTYPTPNRYPPTPDWGWNARVAVFPGENIDGGNPALFELTDAEIQKAIDRFAARGVSLVQTAGFHARMMWIPQWEPITELNRRITAAAHRRGLHVFDHLSCNGMWHRVKDRCGGWCPDEATCVDIRTGLRYPANRVKFCCLNHPEFRRHFFAYITDYVARTGVDGMMCDDMLLFLGQYGCGCRYCRARFKSRLGYPMPSTGRWPLDDYSHPVWRDWIRFRMAAIADFVTELRRRMPADFLFLNDMSQGALGLDDCHHGGGSFETLAAAGANCLICESGGFTYRNFSALPYSNYPSWEHMYVNRKYMNGVVHHYQIPLIQHHYPATPAEGWFCWALDKAMAFNFWRDDAWLYGGPRYADEFTEWKPCYDHLNWEAAHESLWRYARPAADVALLFSFQTKLNLGADPTPHSDEFAGWAQSLQQARIDFDAIIDRDLESADGLRRFKVLILPNAVCLSKRQLSVIREFVRKGGHLIATHRTSLCNEKGHPRPDFGLADLFGVRLDTRPPTQRSAWLLDHRALGQSFAAGLPPRIPFSPVLSVAWDGETASRQAWAWIETTRISFTWPTMPGTVASRVGRGRVIYHLPMLGALAYREGAYSLWGHAPERDQIIEEIRPGQSSWLDVRRHRTPKTARLVAVDDGCPASRQLIANSVRHALPHSRIEVDGLPPGVLWNGWRLASRPNDTSDAGDYVASFLNLTGMQFKPGDLIPPGAAPRYPRLSGTARLIIRGRCCREAQLHSPDLQASLKLRIHPSSSRLHPSQTIAIPMKHVARLAFIRVSFAG